MTEIRFTSEIAVEPIQQVGSDAMLAAAARVSVHGVNTKENDSDADAKLIGYLMRSRHGTPFEHGSLTVRVHAPIKVWREWHRHRVGWCLAGSTEIWTESISPKSGRTVRKRPLAELWRNWHLGVSDAVPFRKPGVAAHKSGRWRALGKRRGQKQVHLGYFDDRVQAEEAHQRWAEENPTLRARLLPSCRNLPARVLNEETHFFEIGRMADIYESGVKELMLVRSEPGHCLLASRDHRLLTPEGWVAAGDLRQGDRVAVCGKRSKFAERMIPQSLRNGIGVWTSQQRCRLIKDVDQCYVCGQEYPRTALVLDHVVPVAADLCRALDVTNLRPICETCHRIKTDGEQILARRGVVAGSKFVRLAQTPNPCAEEMTYDIAMEGPHHNFVANGFVVHNSYNEESGRYRQLEPLFYVPPRDRPMIRPEGFKSARPAFDVATDQEYECVRSSLMQGYKDAYQQYEYMLGLQVDRGLARDVLGVGIYSACYCTANPRSILHFLELRTDHPEAKRPSKPLYEIRVAADKLEAIFARFWPVTHAAWVEAGRAAP